jgi:hypothetical protein
MTADLDHSALARPPIARRQQEHGLTIPSGRLDPKYAEAVSSPQEHSPESSNG